MRSKRLPVIAAVSTLLAGYAAAERPAALSPDVQRFVAIDAPRVVLTHVRVIDGTGAPSIADRNVVIENGRIASIGPGASWRRARGSRARPTGYSVLPGLVGMHDHLYYIARPNLRADGSSEPPLIVPQMTFSAPRLYLAAGVTTIRTTGSVEPYADLNSKRAIEEGRLPGPHVDVTGALPRGRGQPFLQMHPLRDADGRAAHGRVLGRPGRHLVQGLHEHHARRARGRDRGGARARPEGHGAPVLRDLPGSRRRSGSTTSSTASS